MANNENHQYAPVNLDYWNNHLIEIPQDFSFIPSEPDILDLLRSKVVSQKIAALRCLDPSLEIFRDIQWSSGLAVLLPLLDKKINFLEHLEFRPIPEAFGLQVNWAETNMLRDKLGLVEAYVIPNTEIANHPDTYDAYQRALVHYEANRLGIDIFDKKTPLPEPNIPQYLDPDMKKEHLNSFRDHERFLKRTSDWLWLLLRREVQDAFFENLAYSAVPPYIKKNQEMIPASVCSPEFLRKNWAENGVNPTPYLNHVRIREDSQANDIKVEKELTLNGSLSQITQSEGGWSLFMHGIARWELGNWKEDVQVDSGHYVIFCEADRTFLPKLDVDTLVGGLSKFGAMIKKGVTTWNQGHKYYRDRNRGWRPDYVQAGFTTSTISASSMKNEGQPIRYMILTKPTLHKAQNLRPWNASKREECFAQLLEAWPGKFTGGTTDLAVEVLLGLTRIRSFGLLPYIVDVPGSKKQIGLVKTINLFRGLQHYDEAGQGLEIAGHKHSVIQMISPEDALPWNRKRNTYSQMAWWHVLRQVADNITKKGVFLVPDTALPKNENAWKEILSGYQYYHRIFNLLIRELPVLVRDIKKNELEYEDLRLEMRATAQKCLEEDPYRFLMLCSDLKYTDSETAIAGVGLGDAYWLFSLLKGDSEVWNFILTNAKRYQPEKGKTGLDFVVELILKNPSISAYVVKAVRQAFEADPVGVGVRLMMPKENQYIVAPEPAPSGWLVLDKFGLAPWVWNDQQWVLVMNLIVLAYHYKTNGLDAALRHVEASPRFRYKEFNLASIKKWDQLCNFFRNHFNVDLDQLQTIDTENFIKSLFQSRDLFYKHARQKLAPLIFGSGLVDIDKEKCLRKYYKTVSYTDVLSDQDAWVSTALKDFLVEPRLIRLPRKQD